VSIGCTFDFVKVENVLPTSSDVGLVFRRENMAFQVCEVDCRMSVFGSPHPSWRGDLMGYEGCPDGSAIGKVSNV
jgi:hypothetical protein